MKPREHEPEPVFSSLERHLDNAAYATYSVSAARLRGIEAADSQAETSFCRAWEPVSQHLWLRFIFRGLQSSLYTEVKPPSSRMSPPRETTGAVYRHSMMHGLILVTPRRRRARCSCSVSVCVLSGCGGNTERPASKQDSFLDFVRPPPHISFSSLRLFSLFSSPLCTHFLVFRVPSGCGSALSLQPLWPGSSGAWEKLTVVSPENLAESVRKGGRWRQEAPSSAYLLHSRQFFS